MLWPKGHYCQFFRSGKPTFLRFKSTTSIIHICTDKSIRYCIALSLWLVITTFFWNSSLLATPVIRHLFRRRQVLSFTHVHRKQVQCTARSNVGGLVCLKKYQNWWLSRQGANMGHGWSRVLQIYHQVVLSRLHRCHYRLWHNQERDLREYLQMGAGGQIALPRKSQHGSDRKQVRP